MNLQFFWFFWGHSGTGTGFKLKHSIGLMTENKSGWSGEISGVNVLRNKADFPRFSLLLNPWTRTPYIGFKLNCRKEVPFFKTLNKFEYCTHMAFTFHLINRKEFILYYQHKKYFKVEDGKTVFWYSFWKTKLAQIMVTEFFFNRTNLLFLIPVAVSGLDFLKFIWSISFFI